MAARFWVTGGTGNWNSTTNWSTTTGGASGASVPSTSDTATYDASSGAGTATLDISPDIQTLTMTGFTGTLAFGTNTISLNSTGTIFTGATTMTVTGTPQIICTNSSATARTISPGAVTEANSISFRITAGTGTFTITTSQAVRDLDFTDGTNPTGYAGTLQGGNVNIYGNLKASTGMSVVVGTGIFNFNATSGTKTITTAGVVFDRPFTFDGVGGTFQLASALTSGATRTCTLTNGTLNLNNFTLTTGLFSSNNSNTRVLAFGTGKIVLTGTGGTVWTNSTGTGFTYTGTSRIEALGPATSGTRTFNPSTVSTSAEAIALNFYINGGSDTVTFSTTNRRVNILDFTGFTGNFRNSFVTATGNYTLVSGMTVEAGTETTTFATTASQTITTAGQTLDFPVTFNATGGTFVMQDALTLGSTRTCTLTNGTLDLNNFTLTTGLFNSNNSNTRVLALGTGKIVITGNNTTVCQTNTATGLTVTGSKRIELSYSGGVGTRAISGASTATAIEGVNLLDYFIIAGTDIILFNGSRSYGTIDFSNSGTSTFTTPGSFTNAAIDIFGNLTLNSTMVVGGGANNLEFKSTTGTKTITTAGQTLDCGIGFNGIGGTFAFQDALTQGSTRTLSITNGTLQLKSGTTSTVGSFTTTGTTLKFLTSTTPGTQATISQSTGTVTTTYLSVKDNNATGGIVWNATDSSNVDAGNNTGWNFSSNNFFLMFN